MLHYTQLSLVILYRKIPFYIEYDSTENKASAKFIIIIKMLQCNKRKRKEDKLINPTTDGK